MPLKDIVKTLATTEGYEFQYGSRAYLDWETVDKDMMNGQTLINMLPEIRRGIYDRPAPNPTSVSYSVFLQVARKWDEGDATFSDLDETYEQKYDRRLDDLYDIARGFVKSLACANNWEMQSYQDSAEINQYSTNMELINVEFVFITPQFIV